MESVRFEFGRHLVVALAIDLLAPFTVWAWPFAIATGIVIGTADVEKRHGQTASRSTRLVRVVAVTGGVLAMSSPASSSGVSLASSSRHSLTSRSASRPMPLRSTGILPDAVVHWRRAWLDRRDRLGVPAQRPHRDLSRRGRIRRRGCRPSGTDAVAQTAEAFVEVGLRHLG